MKQENVYNKHISDLKFKCSTRKIIKFSEIPDFTSYSVISIQLLKHLVLPAISMAELLAISIIHCSEFVLQASRACFSRFL